MLSSWPPERRTPDLAELDRTKAQKQKDATKLRVTKLAEKRYNEKVVAEVRVVCEAARVSTKQAKAVK